VASGRSADTHAAQLSPDEFDLNALRGKTVEMKVKGDNGRELGRVQVAVETLWG
jgi:hypothetical protein